MRPVHTLLHGAIDYAGLFPPAALDLGAAVANYASYRSGTACWALGRLIVPAARLRELEAAAAPCFPTGVHRWRISALAGGELDHELDLVAAFNERHAGQATVDTIELKASSPDAIGRALAAVDGRLGVYVEIPVSADPGDAVAALAAAGARAKVRAGGVVADAFPSPDDLFRFIQRCAAAGVPFKATAGLHHPLRGEYPLTYAPGSARGTMFGFLNVFLAAAGVSHGMPEETARALLVESSPGALEFDQEGVTYRGARLGDAELRHTRRSLAIAFGSCSFREPIDELRGLGLLA
jgi:hypothetical protein